MRRFTEPKLVVASHNEGKVREIRDLLLPFGVEVLSSKELNLSEPVEDGESFIANAEIKSSTATRESGLVSLADDSGLVVPALDGAPGIHSARYAYNPWKEERDFGYAMGKLNLELGEKPRDAHFVCALSLAWPDGHDEIFRGEANGVVGWPMRGDQGFGFDPIFTPDGHDETFGEMDPAKKHEMSHRADAFARLVAACF